MKEIFSAIGLLFILLFTVRGIWQTAYTVSVRFGDIGAGNWSAVFSTFKQSQCHALDVALMIVCVLLLVHAFIGICFAIATDFNLKNMLKQKILILLQIISALGALYVIDMFIRPHGKAVLRPTHPVGLCIVVTILAALGSFHMANGFVNACVTLGISVSNRTKKAAVFFSAVVAVISMLQIIILFI
jgi:succinate dehydrogenase/fumarate reductase cytochrome b subunit